MVEQKKETKDCPKCDTGNQKKEQEASKPYMFSRK